MDQHGYAPFESAVNDKVMQLSLYAALHRFAVNDGNSKCRFNCTVFCFIPGAREPCRRASGPKAPSQHSKGLADYNPRSTGPSDVWANVKSTHLLTPKVMACEATNTSFQAK